ncbi:MAG: DNA-processing protein DprA [Firmicutes bacterium]|nr:DNA-processing protein DprA [Bacillota bacterium]
MSTISLSKAYYWLSLSGASSKRLNAALSIYSALEIYQRFKTDSQLQSAFSKYLQKMLDTHSLDFINDSLSQVKKKGISVLTLANELYPQDLKQTEVSPPVCLYYIGDLNCLQKPTPCIGVVGTRRPSEYGKQVATSFGRGLAAAGVTVVSGLATGIDTFAHTAATQSGKTAAVLGGGHNHIPPYSQRLVQKIVSGGGIVLSEYQPDFVPTRYSFPERNRIISGLSRGIVVIEAGKKSGALITANFALEQGREVYAVPGEINDAKSEGCNLLIKEGGGAMVTEFSDVLTDLRIEQTAKKSPIQLDIFEDKIFKILSDGKAHFEEILEKSEFNFSQLSTTLLSLEMKSIVKRLSGNIYSLAMDI